MSQNISKHNYYTSFYKLCNTNYLWNHDVDLPVSTLTNFTLSKSFAKSLNIGAAGKYFITYKLMILKANK